MPADEPSNVSVAWVDVKLASLNLSAGDPRYGELLLRSTGNDSVHSESRALRSSEQGISWSTQLSIPGTAWAINMFGRTLLAGNPSKLSTCP